MTHGDDAGLRLPPQGRPGPGGGRGRQATIPMSPPRPRASSASWPARDCGSESTTATDLGLGRRLTDWELKGVPVRVEIGPRDLAQGTVSIARRDARGREPVNARRRGRRRHAPRVQVGPRGAVRPGNRGVEIRDDRCRRSRRRHRSGSGRIRPSALGRLRPRRRAPAQPRRPVGALPDHRRGVGSRDSRRRRSLRDHRARLLTAVRSRRRWRSGRRSTSRRCRRGVSSCRAAVREQPVPRPEHERMDHQQVLVDQAGRHQRSDQVAAAEDRQRSVGLLLEVGHRAAASPSSRIEFSHGSGSLSVRDAMYFELFVSA